MNRISLRTRGQSPADQPRFSRFWQIFFLVVTNLIFLVVLLYGFEFYLGLTDPRLKLPLEPEEQTNSYGFREREFAVPRPDGVCRIMALGDSFTWGKGVWVEDRYTTLTEVYLNQHYPDRKFEVLSFGFPGAHTTKEKDSLAKYKDIVQPDLVTLGFVLNDPKPLRQDYSPEREYFENTFNEFFDTFSNRGHDIGLGHSADLLIKALDSFLVNVGLIPTWEETMIEVYRPDSVEWQAFEQALREIKFMSDEMDLPQPLFLVLNQGTYTDRPTNYAQPDPELTLFLEWYHQAEETAARLGFNPINFQQEFAEELSDQVMAANVLDLHPSPDMHRIYAEKLYLKIVEYVDEGQMCPAAPQPES